jgi:hypothetical protein
MSGELDYENSTLHDLSNPWKKVGWAAAASIVTALAMAFLFWGPSVLIHSVHRQFSISSVVLITISCPLLAGMGAVVHLIVMRHLVLRFYVASLFGIWVFGPVFMMISATFSGGGFLQPDWMRLIIVLTLSSPVATPMMATYDGTLTGLLITSLVLILCALCCAAMKLIGWILED